MKIKRKLRKFLLMLSSAILLVSISVGATVAYLTDTDSVKNTFTVGNVQITLDETDVDLYGVKDGDTRVKANEYKLIPGHQYKKDPTLHVLKGSEDAWVRMLVTVNKHAELKQALEAAGLNTMIDSTTGAVLLQNMVEGWDITKWDATATVNNDDGSAVYEFRYKSIVSAKNAQQDVKLFDNFTLPGAITNKQISGEAEGTTYLGKLEGLTITVEGHAIQADGFANYNAAWDTGWKVNHPN